MYLEHAEGALLVPSEEFIETSSKIQEWKWQHEFSQGRVEIWQREGTPSSQWRRKDGEDFVAHIEEALPMLGSS